MVFSHNIIFILTVLLLRTHTHTCTHARAHTHSHTPTQSQVLSFSCSVVYSLIYSCSFSLHANNYISPVNVRRPHSSGEEKEYAFEMAMSNVRYGEGVTREVGCDVVNLGIKNLCVVTDRNVR